MNAEKILKMVRSGKIVVTQELVDFINKAKGTCYTFDEVASIAPKSIAGLLVSALLITTIGYQAIGYLLNTTLMTDNGITGTNQTLMLVVGLMVIVSIVIKFVPNRGK